MAELVKRVVRYRCVHCGDEYPKKGDAEKCATRGFPATVEIGDVVVAGQIMGWIDGSEAWVHKKTKARKHTAPGFSYEILYVVTLVDGAARDGHRPRYHVRSLAYEGGKSYGRGFTYDYDHTGIKKVTGKKVAALKGIAEALGWMGKQAPYLL